MLSLFHNLLLNAIFSEMLLSIYTRWKWVNFICLFTALIWKCNNFSARLTYLNENILALYRREYFQRNTLGLRTIISFLLARCDICWHQHFAETAVFHHSMKTKDEWLYYIMQECWLRIKLWHAWDLFLGFLGELYL